MTWPLTVSVETHPVPLSEWVGWFLRRLHGGPPLPYWFESAWFEVTL